MYAALTRIGMRVPRSVSLETAVAKNSDKNIILRLKLPLSEVLINISRVRESSKKFSLSNFPGEIHPVRVELFARKLKLA